MKMRLLVSVVAVAMLAAMASPAAAQRRDGYIRAFHNSPDTPAVDIYVDGALALEGVEYGTLSDYVGLPTGVHTIEIKVNPSTPADPAALSTRVAASRVPQTLAAIGSLTGDGGGLQLEALRDPVRTPDPISRVRVAHTSPDAPAVDVQAWIGGAWATLIPGLAFGEDSGYLTLRPGTYDLRVVAAGTDTVVADLSGTTLPAGTAVTAWAVGFLSPEDDLPGFEIFVSVDGR